MRKNTNDTYRWMTQSWLVSMYRHCQDSVLNILGPGHPTDLVCPNASALASFEAAVRRGDITWHAFPHNAEPELYDREFFTRGLQITFEEDAYYDHPRRRTLSQRDVPGLTRAAIPVLAAQGVRAVTVGENGACAPVNVPPIFMWRDPGTDTEVLALFHPHGYGALPPAAEEPDQEPEGIHFDATGRLHLDRATDCVEVPAARTALCYAWNGDNRGPHHPKDVQKILSTLRQAFPQAKQVVPSDAFDDFVQDVWSQRGTLPVVDREIGDTWIQGASSDPLKVAQFRLLMRLRSQCIADLSCDPKTVAFKTFDRLLMVTGEHTVSPVPARFLARPCVFVSQLAWD